MLQSSSPFPACWDFLTHGPPPPRNFRGTIHPLPPSSPLPSPCQHYRHMDIGEDEKSVSVHGSAAQTSRELELPTPEICIICLDRITEKATASPCQHDQFDFACLGTWLQQQQICPLCKTSVAFVTYCPVGAYRSEVFQLPSQLLPSLPQKEIGRRQEHHRNRRLEQSEVASQKTLAAIAVRRRIYEQKLYSLRVGTGLVSGYRNITPEVFLTDRGLQSRARQWIRRELMVFDFLDSETPSYANPDRKATNREYLLEYVIAILKAIDLRGSSGQAEGLVKDYLGGQHAMLFLHELESWLRSPCRLIEDWDRHVQYSDNAAP